MYLVLLYPMLVGDTGSYRISGNNICILNRVTVEIKTGDLSDSKVTLKTDSTKLIHECSNKVSKVCFYQLSYWTLFGC